MLSPCNDPRQLRETFGGFPSGIASLAAVVDGEPTVLIASSFTVGVSQDPPLVLFAVQRSSTTWPALGTAPVVGVSVLGRHHAEVTRQLAGPDKARRFDGVSHRIEDNGAVFLDGAPVWLECSTEHTYPAGDHDIIVLRVHRMRTDSEQQALIWYRSRFAALMETAA